MGWVKPWKWGLGRRGRMGRVGEVRGGRSEVGWTEDVMGGWDRGTRGGVGALNEIPKHTLGRELGPGAPKGGPSRP